MSQLPGGPAPMHEKVVLSPEWLTAMLQSKYPGVEVTSTEVTERLETVATKVRFHLTYAGDPQGAPTDMCAKGYFNEAMHGMVAGTITEALFYREVQHTLSIRTPPCVHAARDEETGHGLVVMNDLKVAGATFLDPTVGYGADQATATLDQLALLHASTWHTEPPAVLEPFSPRLDMLVGIMSTEVLQDLLNDGRAANVPDGVRRADRLQSAMRALAAIETDAHCLVHGDVHTGNIYQFADGNPGIIDWQVAQRGLWALDVAYHVAAVLEPDVRAANEASLLEHYLERLASHGGPTIAYDDAWWLYRAHLAYGYFMWGITRRVVRPVIEDLTRRLSQAVADHDSFGLLGV
jgi:hypothetical protein